MARSHITVTRTATGSRLWTITVSSRDYLRFCAQMHECWVSQNGYGGWFITPTQSIAK